MHICMYVSLLLSIILSINLVTHHNRQNCSMDYQSGGEVALLLYQIQRATLPLEMSCPLSL